MGHGTLVAGVVGAVGNNGKGVTGVAWNVKIMAGKCFDNFGHGFDSAIIFCIEYACTNGARIINASWGITNSLAVSNALARARDAGIIVVAACGNGGTNIDINPTYPTAFHLENVVSVAAIRTNDTLSTFSNYGATNVHLAAPGEQIGVDRQLLDRARSLVRETTLNERECRGVVPRRDPLDGAGERQAVRDHPNVLREIDAYRGAARLELRVRDAAVEIAIEPQQQIDIVERQPNDRMNRAAIHRILGIADAVGVSARYRDSGEDRENGQTQRNRETEKTTFLGSSPLLRFSVFNRFLCHLRSTRWRGRKYNPGACSMD